MRAMTGFLFALLTMALSACGGLQRVASGLADKAPYAEPPEVVQFGAHQWSGDTANYSRGGAFEVHVRLGLANQLLIRENGVEIPRVVSVPALSPAPRTVYMHVADLASDPVTQRTVQRIRIYPREALLASGFSPPPDGSGRTYSFIERSINPRATGKDLVSDPTDVRVTFWGRAPVIAQFSTSPARPAVNVPLDISWRVNDVKQVQILERLGGTDADGNPVERESVIDTTVFNPGPAGSLSGSRTLNVTPSTIAIILRAHGAGGALLTDMKAVVVSGPVPCPDNQPYGQKVWYSFCLHCTGRALEEIQEPACTKDKARDRLEKFYKNQFCEIKDDACYAP
ncbi:MAG: hypothetical protein O9318_00480 [Hylemonella sp.]|uniref:hypothetical protein n=1 Tax=Hylemonella sp. TaxID=2066020 RepID=UPI0022CC157F|nr:hypothetical protein [Hylemonella sp.]MCZ8250923.1 hypothetical protein [Hylemonella sp.]